MTLADLFDKADATPLGPVYTRVSPDHPVDVFVGSSDRMLAIQVRSPDHPPSPPHLAALDIQIYPHNDGRWSTVIRLRRRELRALFVRLAEDLVRATAANPEVAGHAAISQLARWQRLFAPGPVAGLSAPRQRGLFAELLFLRDELLATMSPRMAVAAWKGPFDAPRDFELADFDVEIKAVQPGARSLTISSLEQLDVTYKPVYLWVQTLVHTPIPEGASSRATLNTLVSELREAFTSDPRALEDFEAALQAAEYSDSPDYEKQQVDIGTRLRFHVREDFPRLERSATTSGVLDCTYNLSLPDLAPFICDRIPGQSYGK